MSVNARVLAAVVAALGVVAVPLADARACDEAAHAWLARCAERAEVAMRIAGCPASLLIVEMDPAGAPELRVEISGSVSAFRRAGVYGLAPVGDFPDWQREPEPVRRAFDELARCVERDAPSDLLAHGDAAAPERHEPVGARPPVLFVAALLASLAAWAAGHARMRSNNVVAATVALATVLATLLMRRLLQPSAFFHQNGQGPEWIGYALHGSEGEYGPGYVELFGWIAWWVERPDLGIVVAQEVLAATVPLSAYALARATGASRALAVAFALFAAFDPALVRVGRSESYFSTIAALLFAAAAILAACAGSLRRPRATFALGVLASGLLVAQAARVHPLAWVPCAMVPLAVGFAPGRRPIKRTLVAALGIAAVATPLVLPTLQHALRGHLGSGFLPSAWAQFVSVAPTAGVVLAVAIVGLALPRTRRVAARVSVLLLVAGVAIATDVVHDDAPIVSAAYLHLFAPAATATLANLLVTVRAGSVGWVLVALAAVLHARERSMTVLPTDALELSWCQEWRETLPKGAQVATAQHVGDRILSLPFAGKGLPRLVRIEDDPHLDPGPRFYYRSSLCATPEGAPVCARFESAQRLRLVAARSFPALASLPWLPLPAGKIEVALYEVE